MRGKHALQGQEGKTCPAGSGGENMPCRVRRGKHALGRLVGSGYVGLGLFDKFRVHISEFVV